MRLGALTVVYQDLPLGAALDRLAALGVEAVELGAGGYPGTAHCDPQALLSDPGALRALRDAVAGRDLAISALSCHGNPLHPNPDVARAAHEAWVRTAELAEALEVDVVVTFSGCPGDAAGGVCPNWITAPWPPEYAETLAWQWRERAVPYWGEQCALARRRGVRIALEMHPGFLVYHPESLLSLREQTGPEIAANFDPSHLFWQGIDPVVAIREIGRAGALAHVHAKDTSLDARNIALNGVLDTKGYERVADRAWTFRSVGDGHGESDWRAILAALRVAGYDGTVSIEHEDILLSRDEGLARAVAFLETVIPREPPDEPWWT